MKSRSGFTLVEMLVVIVIIGMLAGMLMVAVNGARSRARITQCTHNQRELAAAIIQYDTAKRRLPGFIERIYCGNDGNKNKLYRAVAWPVVLLPYLHRQDLWEGGWSSGNPADNVRTRVGLFICPDAFPDDQTSLSYVVNVGGTTTKGNWEIFPDGPFRNMIPISGTVATPVSLSNISSLSQRPMLSEARYTIEKIGASPYLPSYYEDDSTEDRKRLWASFSAGTTSFTISDLKDKDNRPMTSSRYGFPWFENYNDPASAVQIGQILPPVHPGVVIVAFCDGHVQSLNSTAECTLYDTRPLPKDE